MIPVPFSVREILSLIERYKADAELVEKLTKALEEMALVSHPFGC